MARQRLDRVSLVANFLRRYTERSAGSTSATDLFRVFDAWLRVIPAAGVERRVGPPPVGVVPSISLATFGRTMGELGYWRIRRSIIHWNKISLIRPASELVAELRALATSPDLAAAAVIKMEKPKRDAMPPLEAVFRLIAESRRHRRSTPSAKRIKVAALALGIEGDALRRLFYFLDFCGQDGNPYPGCERVW